MPRKKKIKADPEVVRKTFEDLTKLRREITPADLDGIPRAELESILQTVTELENRLRYNKADTFYPDTGPLRRELYGPQMEFFKAGIKARERAVVGANGIGKTEGIGGYELKCHMTGIYPDWWEGRRFRDPIHAWLVGDTGQTVKEGIQAKIIGAPGEEGTGMIPGEFLPLEHIKSKAGNVADAIDVFRVKHISGGYSHGTFKSYDQKRRSFQAVEREVIWLDEECPVTIYDECLMRTRNVNGMVMLTFTPLMGITQVVEGFMPNGIIPEGGWVSPSKFTVNATWDHAPHLTDKEKEEILSGTLPYLRDARSKGQPNLGSGVIYPILPQDITVDDFEIPIWYPKAYALDVGWSNTAALWGAWNRETDVVYVWSAYKQPQAEPATHAQAILSRGSWIPGCTDPASRASSQADGKSLFNQYCDLLGSTLSLADNRVSGDESGIFAVWQRLVSGRLKIFRSLTEFFNEFRTYHRDETGKIVKRNDHLMDCLRYLVMTGMRIAIQMPVEELYGPPFSHYGFPKIAANSGRDMHTGY